MSINVEEDIFFTESFFYGNELNDYCKIYYFSNEKVEKMIDSVDVSNKKVLTVLGSGDQAFHLYNKGACRVDLFDKNKLTIYYYYLRRWTILFLDIYYPTISDLVFRFDINLIKKIIKNVVPRNDEESKALDYWNLFVDKFTDENIADLFHLPEYESELKNNNISNIDIIKKRLINDNFNFYNKDFSWNVDMDQKYDIIYISNIPEWIYYKMGGVHLEIFKYNLLKLLNENGIVLGTNLTLKEPNEAMRRIFRDNFSIKYVGDNKNRYTGYQYKKL